MTPEELRLGDTVTTAEWRAIYQPEGHRKGDIHRARCIPPAGVIRPVPRALAEAGEVACENLEGGR